MIYPDQIRCQKATSLKAFISRICIENGSTLDGRKEAFKELIQVRKFIPILVHVNLLLIPIDDMWVNYFSISKVENNKLIFKDSTFIEISNPARIINTKHRILRYLYLIEKAQNEY